MSNNEKTKNKLMETMRMTKADPGKKADSIESKPAKAPQANKPAAKEKKATAKQKTVKASQKVSTDAFQSARRIWPD